MLKRQALLVGVKEYLDEGIPNVPVVENDLHLVQNSLESSGYRVRIVGSSRDKPATRNVIRTEVRRFLRNAHIEDTLLLYFSGHGINFEGCDYFLPADAALDEPVHFHDDFITVDLQAFGESYAKTILLFIDACREGVNLAQKSIYVHSWSNGRLQLSKQQERAIVFACGPGEVSSFVREKYSLFAEALSKVFHSNFQATTFKEVLQCMQKELDSLIAAHGKPSQTIKIRTESDLESGLNNRVICNGPHQYVVSRCGSESRLRSLLESQLEAHLPDEKDIILSTLKQILDRCREHLQQAWKLFPSAAWQDKSFVERVIKQLELLVFTSEPAIELTISELVLLMVVPVFREAIVSSIIVDATKHRNIFDLSCSHDQSECLCQELDRTFSAHSDLIRKATRFKERGFVKVHDTIVEWLLCRCILQSPKSWTPPPEGFLPTSVLGELIRVDQSTPKLICDVLRPDIVLWLTQHLPLSDKDLEGPALLDSPFEIQTLSEHSSRSVRAPVIACLLSLAYWISIDARMLSNIVVEHVGLNDPLHPSDLINTISSGEWKPVGRGRVFSASCNHPVIDLTVCEHMKQASKFLRRLHNYAGAKFNGLETLKGVPLLLDTDGIKPCRVDGSLAYETPLLRLQLAQSEIQELLMGEQLYGDPTLAIRELYQNALDACRYKQARIEYLHRVGSFQGPKWQGKIVFRQGVENGRPYIECQDNGIGMARPQLADAFARAGRRFTAMREFIEEESEWNRCTPPVEFYPNSQFGIGIFSYFMLADELTIETCRFERDGQLKEPLHVQISGSTALFRIRIMKGEKDSGTRVRLYLHKKEHDGQEISCRKILRNFVWLSEFQMVATDEFGQDSWIPGLLKHPELKEDECWRGDDPDIWWVRHDKSYERYGRILADGIVTDIQFKCAVINLHHATRPRLTVDRRKPLLLDYEDIYLRLEKSVASLYRPPAWLCYQWLWSLEEEALWAAKRLVTHFTRRKESFPIGLEKPTQKIPIREVGCFPPDKEILEGCVDSLPPYARLSRILKWSRFTRLPLGIHLMNVWKIWIWAPVLLFWIPLLLHWFWPAISWIWSPFYKISFLLILVVWIVLLLRDRRRASHCPIPQVGDAILLSESLTGTEPWHALKFTEDHIQLAAAKLRENIPCTLKRLQRYTSVGIHSPDSGREVHEVLDLEDGDLVAFSTNLNGKSPWIKGRIDAAHIIGASQKLSESVGRVLERLRKWRYARVEIPPHTDPTVIQNLKANRDDCIALSMCLDGKPPWVTEKNDYNREDLVPAAHALGCSVKQLLLRLRKFEPLGIRLPDLDPSDFEDLYPSEEDLIAFSADFDGESPWIGDSCSVQHLLEAAYELNTEPEEVYHRLERFSGLGLTLPRLDELKSAGPFEPPIPHRNPIRPQFTLFELLVVIGIIGVFLAILMPVLDHARQIGRKRMAEEITSSTSLDDIWKRRLLRAWNALEQGDIDRETKQHLAASILTLAKELESPQPDDIRIREVIMDVRKRSPEIADLLQTE
ncbi:caspase family protein [Planctomycetota bacterium]